MKDDKDQPEIDEAESETKPEESKPSNDEILDQIIDAAREPESDDKDHPEKPLVEEDEGEPEADKPVDDPILDQIIDAALESGDDDKDQSDISQIEETEADSGADEPIDAAREPDEAPADEQASPPPPLPDPPSSPPPSPPQDPPSSAGWSESESKPVKSSSSERTFMLILAYLGPFSLAPYFMKSDDREIYWHARQGLALFLTEIGIALGYAILLHVPVLGCLAGCLGCVAVPLTILVLLIMHAYLILKALDGERTELPLIGAIARRL